jgi:hypothetical protein
MQNTTTHSQVATFVTPSGQIFSTAFVEPLLDRDTPKAIAIDLIKALDVYEGHCRRTSFTKPGWEEAMKVKETLKLLRNIFLTGGESIDL